MTLADSLVTWRLLLAGMPPPYPAAGALVARARRGDPSAFEEIVRRHQQRVYNHAYRMLRRHEDAEDVTQEAFLKAFESLPRLRDDAALGAWICRIAANLCLSWLRGQARVAEISRDPAALPSHEPDGSDMGQQVRDAVLRLPAKYRLAVVAFYLEGRSYEEAARTIGVPVRTLKTLLYRARKLLRQSLRPGEGGAP